MPVSTDDLIIANNKAIQRLEDAEKFIKENRFGLPMDERFFALTVISDIDTRLRVLKFTQAHLAASQVVVEFTAADMEKLQALEKQLDQFIIEDAGVEAVLNSVPDIMTAAGKVNALINVHIA